MRLFIILLAFIGICLQANATQTTSNSYQQPPKMTTLLAHPPGFVSINDFLTRGDTFHAFYQMALQLKIDTEVLSKISSGGATRGEGGITLLLPVDSAFSQVVGKLNSLPSDDLRRKFIYALILSKRVPASDLYHHAFVETRAGEPIETKGIPRPIYTIETDNGIIHVLDRMPWTIESLKHKVYGDSQPTVVPSS